MVSRRTWRALAAAVALLLLVPGAGGCGGDAPAAAAPVELDFWYMPDGPHPGVAIQREVELFEGAHPGVRVRATQVPWEEALTRLTTATASGQAPDVMQVGSTWVAGLDAQGAFRPVSDADLAALGGREAFVESSWRSAVPLGTTRPVAVPWLLDTRVVFYRADVLAAAGVDPSSAFATWEAFEGALQRLQEATGQRPLGFPGVSDWNVVHNAAPWVTGAGGRVLDDEGRPALDARVVDGLDELQRLVGTYGRPDVLAGTDDDAKRGFARGDYPVVISGTYTAPVLDDEGTAPAVRAGWAVAELPAGPAGRVGFLGGSDLAVSRGSEHPAQAREWIAALTSPAAQQRLASSGGLLPALRAAPATSDPRTAAVFAAAAEHGRQYPPVPHWIDVEAQLQHDLSDMWRAVLAAGAPLPRAEVEAVVAASARRVAELTAT